jgi:hypothetical protein
MLKADTNNNSKKTTDLQGMFVPKTQYNKEIEEYLKKTDFN